MALLRTFYGFAVRRDWYPYHPVVENLLAEHGLVDVELDRPPTGLKGVEEILAQQFQPINVDAGELRVGLANVD
ncbi:MAG: hypothetical protein P4L67_00745 [Candidatus Pacebacteria bacterium]|nr:hypothetical protein [Candidatus Paceibacterota bacterium]